MSIQSDTAIQIIKTQMIVPRMKELGYSQKKLSELSGISEPFISQWLSGQSDISLSKFLDILRAVEINPFFIHKEDDNTKYENRIFFN